MGGEPVNLGTRLRSLYQDPVIRSFAWSFAGGLSSRIAVMATTVIAARGLTPEDFAAYVGLSSVALLATAGWDAGVSALLVREFAKGEMTLMRALARAAILRLKTSPVWIVIFFGGATALARHGIVPPLLESCFAAYSLVFGIETIMLSILRAKLRFRKAEAVISLGRWVTGAMSIWGLLMVKQEHRLGFFAVAMLAGECSTLLLATMLAIGEPDRHIRSNRNREPSVSLTLSASLPFAANSILAMAYNRFDVVIVAALTSPSQVASYVPASRIQDALFLLPGAMGTVALPFISRGRISPDHRLDVTEIVRRLTRIGLTVSFIATLLLGSFTRDFIRLVFGNAYLGAVHATQILVWFLPMAVVASPLLALLAGTDHAGDTTTVFGAAFGVAIVCHLLLDSRFGAVGAAVASLARDPVALLVTYALVKKRDLIP